MERMNSNFKDRMIETGLLARLVLSTMFDCDERDILFMYSRKQNKVSARRFYIYYLWKYKNISHNRMKEYVNNICHATSIYQCRLCEDEIKSYRKVRQNFITFMYYADPKEYEKMRIDQVFTSFQMNDLKLKSKYRKILT